MLNNERGSLTIDFLFATVLVMGVSGILFALCFTLSIVEISQYIAFSTSRNYYASHYNQETQSAMAEAKYNQLVYDSPWKVFFRRESWFNLKYINSGDFRTDYPPVSSSPNENARFWGTVLELESKVLDIQIPFYGSTNPDEGAFKTKINSFLGRESTADECIDFHSQRFEEIKKLNPKFQANIPTPNTVSFYDNGC